MLLDKKDRRLLVELDRDSRQAVTVLAQAVGVSKQVASFRIKRLLEQQVISSLYTVIDVSKLGYTIHKTFVRLQNTSGEEQSQLIAFLQSHPDVVWVASCDGQFDLAFGTRATDMAHFDNTLAQLSEHFGEHLRERAIASIIHGEYFVRDYLVQSAKPSSFRSSSFGSTPQTANVDEHDGKILVALARNSRTTAVELAAAVGLSADAVAQRIKKLERSGVIRHYNIVPNEAVYPYMHYKVLVNFRNPTQSRITQLIAFCRLNPNIVYIVKALGPWEFEIDLEVENAEKFRSIMMEIKSNFSDLLNDYSTLHIYQVHKYNFCPSLPTPISSRR